MRNAGANRDRADMDVAEKDMPAALALGIAAAGDGGHAPHDPADLTDREATVWGRGRPAAHHGIGSVGRMEQIRCVPFWRAASPIKFRYFDQSFGPHGDSP
jgi:hypothetical protein